MYIFNQPQHLYKITTRQNNLEEELINDILQFSESLPTKKAEVNDQTDIDTTRQSYIKWINFSDETSNLFNFLTDIFKQVNSLYYNFNIEGSYDSIQYTEYHHSIQGKYDWHMDSGFSMGYPNRKLSLTIQLSDPTEYEGGDVEVWYPDPNKGNLIEKLPREKGKVIIFPSYLWHRVTPVTKGVRKSLVWWVGGTIWR